MVAAGPVPALFIALTLKVYGVKGLKLNTSQAVVLASCTGISGVGAGPSTCTLYPVMTPFRFSTGRSTQESFAVVGRL